MLLEVKNLSKEFSVESGFFQVRAATVRALDRVSFSVKKHTTLGIVGESGSGKTTLAKIILSLIPPTSGEVLFDRKEISNFRKDVQIIFQNPYSSLNPKMRILEILAEPLRIHRLVSPKEMKGRVIDLLRQSGIHDEKILIRYPHEFSGGQRQRICIARALATQPKVLVLDEPISSLDLTIQARLLELFLELKERHGLTYIFVSHNISVIKKMANEIMVMKEGRVIEIADNRTLFVSPQHDYTRLLIESARA